MATTKKTVLITGSTRSIGLSLAKYYTKANWNVIGTARPSSNTDQLNALSPFKVVTLDTIDEASILEAARQVDGVPIDLLINNAGIWIPDTFESATKEALMRQFEVNAVGPFLTTRALLPNLELAAKKHGFAYVAQVTSLLGSISSNTAEMDNFFSKAFGYAPSKAALNMATRSMSVSLRHKDIGFVTLNPGYVATDMNEHQGYLTPEESAESMAKIVEKLILDDTGKFYNADKQYPAVELPW
ncbi:short chain dehydrogenase [Phytophthora infestans]|uniref:Short chain dehydrogenase n=1 Tax=Phytophthora infestans TaxID=4787 RepID=A0A8S9V230_PHYIN|nr:short chain dehydrogenase [Phytophthora infestans]